MNNAIKSQTEIWQSKDYKQFKLINGNRTINDAKIKKIIKDIDGGLNMLPYCPIIVDEKLCIIDGQHRYKVSKILKQPVYFIIANEKTVYEIAKMNSRTERWKAKDFLNCYLSQGNEHYVILDELQVSYSLTITACRGLLTHGYACTDNGNGQKEAFERGEFVVHKKDEAFVIAEKLQEFATFDNYKSYDFICATAKLLSKPDKCNWDELVAAYNKRPELLLMQASAKQYLANLEEIYNIGKKVRRVIY
jgi:hypothetical protein